jgi:hypothetical protein
MSIIDSTHSRNDNCKSRDGLLCYDLSVPCLCEHYKILHDSLSTRARHQVSRVDLCIGDPVPKVDTDHMDTRRGYWDADRGRQNKLLGHFTSTALLEEEQIMQESVNDLETPGFRLLTTELYFVYGGVVDWRYLLSCTSRIEAKITSNAYHVLVSLDNFYFILDYLAV